MPAEKEEAEFLVRRFRQGDAEAASAILLEAKEAANWPESALERIRSLRGVIMYVGESKGEVTGFIIGRQVADEGEILNLAVRRAFRRRGEGCALAGKLLDRFEGLGVVKVFLEVRESNDGAICFYEKLGFRRVGRRPAYYREPEEAALILERVAQYQEFTGQVRKRA